MASKEIRFGEDALHVLALRDVSGNRQSANLLRDGVAPGLFIVDAEDARAQARETPARCRTRAAASAQGPALVASPVRRRRG